MGVSHISSEEGVASTSEASSTRGRQAQGVGPCMQTRFQVRTLSFEGLKAVLTIINYDPMDGWSVAWRVEPRTEKFGESLNATSPL
jgi:hypothetical protein